MCAGSARRTKRAADVAQRSQLAASGCTRSFGFPASPPDGSIRAISAGSGRQRVHQGFARLMVAQRVDVFGAVPQFGFSRHAQKQGFEGVVQEVV